ncbi:MAG TPA: OsmC family protein [Nocardioidaceae bacterium]|nr:OsmC family protein [Nocardioidaceae bacterium]
MTDENVRTVDITRIQKGLYEATNKHGMKIVFGNDNTKSFSAVELLLAAIAGCSGTDVDFITSKRSEPADFHVRISGDKVRDESGKNHVANIRLTFDITFPEGEEGDAARGVLERAVHQSHDRLCSVSQTVMRGTPIEVHIADQAEESA